MYPTLQSLNDFINKQLASDSVQRKRKLETEIDAQRVIARNLPLVKETKTLLQLHMYFPAEQEYKEVVMEALKDLRSPLMHSIGETEAVLLDVERSCPSSHIAKQLTAFQKELYQIERKASALGFDEDEFEEVDDED